MVSLCGKPLSSYDDVFDIAGHELFGTVWFGATGGQGRMQSRALLLGHRCQIALDATVTTVRSRKKSIERGYMSYPDWQHAVELLVNQMPPEQLHVFEIIPAGQPSKVYIDIDKTGHPLPDAAHVIALAEKAVRRVLAEEFHVQVTDDEFMWSESPNQVDKKDPSVPKFSLHMVVNAIRDGRHVMLADNFNHAKYVAKRVGELEPELRDYGLDMSVYSRNRLFRIEGGCKEHSPWSRLTRFRPDLFSFEDTLVAWPKDNVTVLEAPAIVPEFVLKRRKPPRNPHELSNTAGDPEIVKRMLELLREKVHPTAFKEARGPGEDVHVGVRFNWHDRTEPCYTGNIHDGTMNLCCFLEPKTETIYARCFSGRCRGETFRLGTLRPETPAFPSLTVQFDTPKLTMALGTGSPLDAILHQWTRGDFKALCIKSPMDTGKTTLVAELLKDIAPGAPVLCISYRRTLAYDLAKRLPGFVNYLDIPNDEKANRDLHPRLVIQWDSIPKLWDQGIWAPPPCELIILDEIESLIGQMIAETVKKPGDVMERFAHLCSEARRIIAMDGTLGAATYDLFRSLGVSQRLASNLFRPPPRNFSIVRDNGALVRRGIIDTLRAGENATLASMSAQFVHDIETAIKQLGLLPPDKLLVHTAKSDDSHKTLLHDVEAAWITRTFVGYSPTVEAGVDCSVPHFHRLYGYACTDSTTYSGFLQMLFRVRKLEHSDVLIGVQTGMSLIPTAPRVTAEQMADFLTWMVASVPEAARILETRRTQTRAGVFMLPDVKSPMFTATAHGLARKANSANRFVAEFKDLAEALGHTVTVQAPELSPEKVEPRYMVEKLLGAPDVDEGGAKVLRRKMSQNLATEQDKWTLARHEYRKYWGLAPGGLDRNFMGSHDARVPSMKTERFMDVIGVSFARSVGDYVIFEEYISATQAMRVELVRNVLQCLGWECMLREDDPPCENARLPLADVVSCLKRSELCKAYAKNVAILSAHADRKNELTTPKDVRAVLDVVLRTIGLETKATSKRKGSDHRVYTYEICSDSLATMRGKVDRRLGKSPKGNLPDADPM